jgi:hypothetical protein
MAMRPAILEARTGIVHVLTSLGLPAEAQLKLDEAHAVIEEIASLFKTEKLRTMYLESARAKLDSMQPAIGAGSQ